MNNLSAAWISGMVCIGLLGAVGGCSSSPGIAVNEWLGNPKREQLVDRVQAAKTGQEDAKQQFADALEEFMAVTRAQGGELERVYSRLKSQLDRCESRADTVTNRINSVENVADALFREWQRELDAYQSENLRSSSELQLRQTKNEYERLLTAMQRAESSMEPVLQAFRDQVLFLKHNLNARAVASLQNEVGAIESEVQSLIAEMNASINEANAFIESMGNQG